jgi:hypothetical protein
MSTDTRVSRQYRYYDFFMAAYVCIVLCANLIGAAKKSTVHLPLFGEVTFLAGVLFFPLSYLFGDILTEVYGYARRPRICLDHGQRHRGIAADGRWCRGTARGSPHLWRDAAHRRRFYHRLLVRLLRQQLRDGQNEAVDRRSLALDANRRIDALRRTG